MPFFHIRSLAGTAWPPIPEPEFAQLWAMYLELDRTQWLSPSELEERQLSQLRALVQHCDQQVPYYHRLLAQAGLTARKIQQLSDFRRLPLLTRDLYQKHFADIQARTVPAGMTVSGGSHTSGTNGVPLKVLMTTRAGLWFSAFYLRDLEWCGFDPRGRLAAIRLMAMTKEDLPGALEGRSAPNWHRACQMLAEPGPSFGMDIRQDPRRQLLWLKRIRPNYLLSMPSNLEILAGLVADGSERLSDLRAIQAMGEPLPEGTRQRVEAAFGVPVKNTYSATEAGYLASPCPAGDGFHVHSENVIAEVLGTDGAPCLPGQTGRLVFTALHNFATPFLRYDILDDVTLAPAPCPCGRGLPLWTQIEGRRHTTLDLPDGRRKSSMGITLGLRKVAGVHQFQIIQRAIDHVVLRVVPDRTWTADHADRMRQVVIDEFEATVRVDVEEKKVLERSPGGKLKLVINELEPASSPQPPASSI